jgi:hypothetical protein
MSRTDNEGRAYVATDPDVPLNVELENEVGGPLDVSVVGGMNLGSVSIDSLPHANMGAFGDLETMALTPVLQLSFATGLRDQLITSATANSGTVDSDTGRLRLQTGTNAAGSAIASSVRPVAYRPGQGVTARFTPIWTTAAASSRQIAGMGTPTDGYFVGYNGVDFGICHRLAGVDAWVTQANWNGDKCNGSGASGLTLDHTKGNVWQIKYPYLGHGNIRVYVLDPTTSLWILAHTIRYANASALPQLTNPMLSFRAEAVNTGNTSNLISYVTCAAAFIDGVREYLGPAFGWDSGKSSITAETNLLSIRNATTVNGVPNRGLIRLRQISYSSDANSGYATIRIRRGATVGGTPSFAAVSGTIAGGGATLTNAQSTASVDTAGTTATGGTVQWNAVCFNDSAGVIDLTPFNIFISPGETITISGAATNSSTQAVAVNWNEDVQ